MKAIAVFPGKPNSAHLAELAKPSASDVPGGRGVLVKVLRVGVDGTDREINAAEYGAAPDGYDFLVLLEPMTVAQKGITQAYEIQRRLKVWRPRLAAVMGAGTLGLLASLVLRLRGLQVTTFGRTKRPYLNADLLDRIGARYVATAERSIKDVAAESQGFDLIFEGTGSSEVVFESMQVLAKNGVL